MPLWSHCLRSDQSQEYVLQGGDRCLLGEQLLRNSLSEEATTMQHKHSLADEAGLSQGVSAQEHRPRTGEPLDQLAHFDCHLWVQADSGLVQDQDRWIAQERLR